MAKNKIAIIAPLKGPKEILHFTSKILFFAEMLQKIFPREARWPLAE